MACLPSKPIGSSILRSSAIGLGCMSLTAGAYGQTGIPEEAAIAVIRRAIDLGVTLLNTSDLYGPYTNEEIVGKAIKGYDRQKLVITTKWGTQRSPAGQFVWDLSPDNCRACCKDALKRLDVDYIDVFIMRGPVLAGSSIEEVMQAMKELVEAGKVKALGLSEVSAATLRRAHVIHPISVLEQEWSLFARDIEEDLVPTCKELGISVLAYSPFNHGLLTGQVKSLGALSPADMRHRLPQFANDNLVKNLKLVAKLEELAQKKGCTPAQLALAWVLHKGGDMVIPIPGTKQIKYLEENVAAVHVQLSADEAADLEAAVPHQQVAGDRYHAVQISYHAET